MKEYYTIGEMAKMNFVSVPTLRYYDKIGILKPSYVNEKTGYRYYSQEDFVFLDAIQYLKLFDMSLGEIKEQFDNRTVENTLELYEHQLVKLRENIAAYQNIEKIIMHNIENLKTSRDAGFSDDIKIMDLEERYAIILSDSVMSDDEYEVAIRKLSHNLYANNFQYMGDFIGIKSTEDINAGKFNIVKKIGNMCVDKPEGREFITIPAGKYLRMCYVGVTEEINTAYFKIMEYTKEHDIITKGEVIEAYAIDCMYTKNPKEYVAIIDIPIEI